MTLKFPEPNMLDKFLHFIGKRRGVTIPANLYKNYGQYVYAKANKESFWKALLRRKGVELPTEMVDIFEYSERQKKSANSYEQ